MKEFKYVVTDAQGIHARPAGILVKQLRKKLQILRSKKQEIHVKSMQRALWQL